MPIAVRLEDLTWSEAQCLNDEFPFIFKALCIGGDMSDKLENVFNEEYHAARDKDGYLRVLRKINGMAQTFLQNHTMKIQAKEAEALFNSGAIPLLRQDNSFENFETPTEMLKTAKRQAQEYIMQTWLMKRGRNLIIAGLGDVGTGKTHLAVAIAKEAVKKSIPALFINSTQMLSDLKKDFDASPYIRAGLLIIDDLGKIKTTSWAVEQLYLILDTRYNNGLPTVITVEDTPQMVEQQFGKSGKALLSRLCSNYMLIKCTGEDYRLCKNEREDKNDIKRTTLFN